MTTEKVRLVNTEENVVEEKEKEYPKLSIRNQLKNKKNRTRFITRVSMFSALATIFYAWLKFPLPIFPSFLEISFSNLFIIIGSLSTGPIGGIIICVVRMLLKLLIVGTHTNFVGELTDLLLSLCISLPASIVYMRKHTKMGGFIGISLAFLSWIVWTLLINYYVSMPLYIKLFFQSDESSFVNTLSLTIKGVNEDNFAVYYLFLAVLPFNAINGFLNCGIAFIVYKKISVVLKKIGL